MNFHIYSERVIMRLCRNNEKSEKNFVKFRVCQENNRGINFVYNDVWDNGASMRLCGRF